MKHKESNLQQRCISYFRRLWPEYALLFFSVPNGGKRNKREAAILKAEGMLKGVADTLLLVPAQGFHGLAIEFKKEDKDYDIDGNIIIENKTYQEKEQKEWQRAVEAENYKYVVIRDRDEFDQLIDWYLGKRY